MAPHKSAADSENRRDVPSLHNNWPQLLRPALGGLAYHGSFDVLVHNKLALLFRKSGRNFFGESFDSLA
jgi:hypothetical protein